jgi:heme/copper-type cytochrome/quinol oxidase subunit 3
MNTYLNNNTLAAVSEKVLTDLRSKGWLKSHPILITGPSYIPFFTMVSAYLLFISTAMVFEGGLSSRSIFLLVLSLSALSFSFFLWMRTLAMESDYSALNSRSVGRDLLTGMILFIASEVMLFFGFFWAFFSSALSPSIFIGGVWPPVNIVPLNAFTLPLLNTLILLTSGVSINAFYYKLKGLNYDLRTPSELFNYIPLTTLVDYNSASDSSHSIVRKVNELRSITLPSYTYLYTILELSKFVTLPKEGAALSQSRSFLPSHPLFRAANVVDPSVDNGFSLTSDSKGAFNDYMDVVKSGASVRFALVGALTSAALSGYTRNPALNALTYALTTVRNLKKLYIAVEVERLLVTLGITIALGVLFLSLQVSEYTAHATFALGNLYGSIFYFTTGLHGMHVFVGTLALFATFVRLFRGRFALTFRPHPQVTCVVWYWHFVDVVWLFLFIFVYIWGGR